MCLGASRMGKIGPGFWSDVVSPHGQMWGVLHVAARPTHNFGRNI
jgi:hypothetical protein